MLGNCDGKASAGSMPEAGDVSPEVWTKMLMKVAQLGFSSEFKMRIAALMLPSSSFATNSL